MTTGARARKRLYAVSPQGLHAELRQGTTSTLRARWRGCAGLYVPVRTKVTIRSPVQDPADLRPRALLRKACFSRLCGCPCAAQAAPETDFNQGSRVRVPDGPPTYATSVGLDR